MSSVKMTAILYIHVYDIQALEAFSCELDQVHAWYMASISINY